MKSSFDTLVMVGALGLGAWVLLGGGLKTIRNVGGIVETTTYDAGRIASNTTRVISNAVIAVENVPGNIYGFIKGQALATKNLIWGWIT